MCRESCHLQLVSKPSYRLLLGDSPHLLSRLLQWALASPTRVCIKYFIFPALPNLRWKLQVDANPICKLHGYASSAMKQLSH